MSSTLKTNKEKLEEMKRRREQRNRAANQSEASEAGKSELKVERRELSTQKSENIHVTGALVETYDMEIQCALETRSLDSKAHKQIESEQNENQSVDLLQPKEHNKRRKEHKDEHAFQTREIHELNQEELESLTKSKHFTDFFNKSSKFLEKVLDHGDGDILQMILRDGFRGKDLSDDEHNSLSHGVTFSDANYTLNRVVTDLDWSPQISDLLLASYSENEEGSIKDHVGVALLWNPTLKTRPQFYCFCQSAITSAKFYPYSNNTVIGGCYNGQLLMWDIRTKSMPVLRSDISADAHKYPVNSLSVIGTQIANNVASFSNDGMQCIWDIKQFTKPIRKNVISAARPTRTLRSPNLTGAGSSAMNRSSRVMENSTSAMREEIHEINVTTCAFPRGDANNYYIGSLNGAMYKNALHNRGSDNIQMFDDHNGPISGLSVNHCPEYDFLNGLVLSSSFDWTVKLWNPNQEEKLLKTFESSEDFIYDVKWNPTNPTLFATVNNDGFIDLFDLTKDTELPVVHKKVNGYAQNKMTWNTDGTAMVSGDSAGNVHLYGLGEKYRKVDPTKLDSLKKGFQVNEESQAQKE